MHRRNWDAFTDTLLIMTCKDRWSCEGPFSRDDEFNVCCLFSLCCAPQRQRRETCVSVQRCPAGTPSLQSHSRGGVAACWIRYFPPFYYYYFFFTGLKGVFSLLVKVNYFETCLPTANFLLFLTHYTTHKNALIPFRFTHGFPSTDLIFT